MKVKILRQQLPDSEPYWETFIYDGPIENSVAGVLDHINYKDDVVNADGERSTRVVWECSCLQGVCGACAMVINNTPALACNIFLKDLGTDTVELRPLRKFPVLHDLTVDRLSIHENLKKMNVYIGEYDPLPGEDHDLQYTAAKCIKCGLCLEVCPNYMDGTKFFGALFANDCYLTFARNKNKASEIKKAYADRFGGGCSKALSCMEVCPVKIQTIASMARLNRSK